MKTFSTFILVAASLVGCKTSADKGGATADAGRVVEAGTITLEDGAVVFEVGGGAGGNGGGAGANGANGTNGAGSNGGGGANGGAGGTGTAGTGSDGGGGANAQTTTTTVLPDGGVVTTTTTVLPDGGIVTTHSASGSPANGGATTGATPTDPNPTEGGNPAGFVEFEKVESDATPPEDVIKALKKYRDSYRSCYGKALGTNGHLQGSIRFKVVVEPTGAVRRVDVIGGSLPPSPLIQCSVAKTKLVKLPTVGATDKFDVVFSPTPL